MHGRRLSTLTITSLASMNIRDFQHQRVLYVYDVPYPWLTTLFLPYPIAFFGNIQWIMKALDIAKEGIAKEQASALKEDVLRGDELEELRVDMNMNSLGQQL